MTATTAPTAQISGVYRRKVGDIVVTAISDGYLDAVYEFTRNITPQDAERILKEAYRPTPPRVSINTFVIHSAGPYGARRYRFGPHHGPDARPHAGETSRPRGSIRRRSTRSCSRTCIRTIPTD